MEIIVSKEERLAKAIAFAEAAKAEQLDTLKEAYKQAVADGDAETAAAAARAVRDKLLTLSDKEVTLDRVGIDTSSVTALIASLKNVFGGLWSNYRKLLRDLPEQEGFPFDIEWPEAPDGGNGDEE